MAFASCHLGCPIWSNRDWVGESFAAGAKPSEFLHLHAVSLGSRPFIRYIGHPDPEANRPFLAPWLDKLALWLNEGREPYVFVHTPNNRQAPRLARLFHELLRARCPEVGMLPPWPGGASGSGS